MGKCIATLDFWQLFLKIGRGGEVYSLTYYIYKCINFVPPRLTHATDKTPGVSNCRSLIVRVCSLPSAHRTMTVTWRNTLTDPYSSIRRACQPVWFTSQEDFAEFLARPPLSIAIDHPKSLQTRTSRRRSLRPPTNFPFPARTANRPCGLNGDRVTAAHVPAQKTIVI